jgi:hypothetical protein
LLKTSLGLVLNLSNIESKEKFEASNLETFLFSLTSSLSYSSRGGITTFLATEAREGLAGETCSRLNYTADLAPVLDV